MSAHLPTTPAPLPHPAVAAARAAARSALTHGLVAACCYSEGADATGEADELASCDTATALDTYLSTLMAAVTVRPCRDASEAAAHAALLAEAARVAQADAAIATASEALLDDEDAAPAALTAAMRSAVALLLERIPPSESQAALRATQFDNGAPPPWVRMAPPPTA